MKNISLKWQMNTAYNFSAEKGGYNVNVELYHGGGSNWWILKDHVIVERCRDYICKDELTAKVQAERALDKILTKLEVV